MTFWQRHFLVMDASLPVAIASALAIWHGQFEGSQHLEELLEGNRANVYRTVATISGTLLGFSLASASFALNAVSSPRLKVLRNSQHLPTLWKTFFQTTWFLGAACVMAVVCIIWDRETAPNTWLPIPLTLFAGLSVVRIMRTIHLLERIIVLGAGQSASLSTSRDTESDT